MNKIALIGEGNIAWFLAQKLQNTSFSIQEIYTRNNTTQLGSALHIKSCATFEEFSSEIILLAVNDDAVEALCVHPALKNKILVYFSGSIPLQQIAQKVSNIICLWPIYSISKNTIPTQQNIPFIINASNEYSLWIAKQLVAHLTNEYSVLNDDQKKYLHLCATIVNNFSNHLFHIAEDILAQQKINRNLLLPLFENTVEKLKQQSAQQNQTGPAKRHDNITLHQHLSLLQNPLYKSIYELITKSIQNS